MPTSSRPRAPATADAGRNVCLLLVRMCLPGSQPNEESVHNRRQRATIATLPGLLVLGQVVGSITLTGIVSR
jgi:hypothetical protein